MTATIRWQTNNTVSDEDDHASWCSYWLLSLNKSMALRDQVDEVLFHDLWQSATSKTSSQTAASEETHGTGRGIFVKANIASHPRESILYQSWCRFLGLLGDGDGTITLSHLYQWPAREYSIILRIFADDSLHYWKINFIADAEQLQIDLKSLKKCKWERQMEFHPRNVQSSISPGNNNHKQQTPPPWTHSWVS